MEKVFGIDVSKWQGNFNFERAKQEGVKFAILRGAYAKSKDSKFDAFYNTCKELNIPIGVYHYSMAKNIAEARAEAQFLIDNVLKGRQFEYPIWMDVEDATQRVLGKELLTNIVIAYCEVLEKNGYYTGIYSSSSFFKTYMDESKLTQYDKWVAQWSSKCTYNGNYGMWQYGGESNMIRDIHIAGQICDQNYAYVDYPSIIKSKGYNGFSTNTNTPVQKPTPETVKKSVNEIAKEVLDGLWGNGEDRKQKLTKAGYDYNAVQKAVNQMISSFAPKDITYIIKTGDTLGAIAKKYNTTVEKIAAKNGIKNPNKIYAGTVIKI